MKFPDPIPLSNHVLLAREARVQELVRVAIIGVLLRLVIVLMEFGGFVFFGSASLFMDGIATLVDITSSLILIISLKFAARPPDDNHPFGHGRFEPLIGLQLSLLLIIVGAALGLQQAFLSTPDTEIHPIYPLAWLIPALATVILLIATRMVYKTAKEKASTALKADAAHFSADAATSLIATLALLAGSFFPGYSHLLDQAGALLIAVSLIILGIQAARENFAQLMDQVPDSKYFEEVKAAALGVPGVFGTEKIRIQLYGPDAHVDIDIEVDPVQSVEEAHLISQKVRAAIQHQIPLVRDVTVHIEPYYKEGK